MKQQTKELKGHLDPHATALPDMCVDPLHTTPAVVIISCDRYSDLWTTFFALFARYWPTCPYPLYLISNEAYWKHAGVTSVVTGPDMSWSTTLLRGLAKIAHDHVLLFLEDLFLCAPVQGAELDRLIGRAVSESMNCLRLHADPPSDRKVDDVLGEIAPGAVYRTSTVLTFWRKSLLVELLREGESAWDFEVFGSTRSDEYGGFYATHSPQIQVMNGVIKGKWRPGVVRRLRSLGIEPDLKTRDLMTPLDRMKFMVMLLRHRVFCHLPGAYRGALKHLLLRGQYRYSPSSE